MKEIVTTLYSRRKKENTMHLTLLHSEQPKLHREYNVLNLIALRTAKTPGVLAVLSAIGLKGS